MTLRAALRDSDINLSLRSTTKDAVLAELVAGLGLGAEAHAVLLKILQRREAVGSTAIGHGVAIPHCRTPLVSQLRVVLGKSSDGIAYDAPDGAPVHLVFLLVAPPPEVSNEYLQVLSRIAKLVKDQSNVTLLREAKTRADVVALLETRDV